MSHGSPISPAFMCHFKRQLCSFHNLSDKCGIRKTIGGMSRLMGPDHHVADDGRQVDHFRVKDGVNEIGSVIYQAFSISGWEDVVFEDAVEDFDYRSASLVNQLLAPFYSKVSLWMGNAIGSFEAQGTPRKQEM